MPEPTSDVRGRFTGTVGTRSVLLGAHCFFLHPFFVARAWWQLYGFPWDPRLWVAFFVHDLGYIGKPNMDGPEGETHPQFGARVMGALFDRAPSRRWFNFTLLHSRYYAKQLGLSYSRLCVADKLALAITPAWLYLPMARWSGELAEYLAHAKHRIQGNEAVSLQERDLLLSADARRWFDGVTAYMRRWVEEHRDGRADHWTSNSRQRATVGDDGVWR